MSSIFFFFPFFSLEDISLKIFPTIILGERITSIFSFSPLNKKISVRFFCSSPRHPPIPGSQNKIEMKKNCNVTGPLDGCAMNDQIFGKKGAGRGTAALPHRTEIFLPLLPWAPQKLSPPFLFTTQKILHHPRQIPLCTNNTTRKKIKLKKRRSTLYCSVNAQHYFAIRNRDSTQFSMFLFRTQTQSS